MPFLKRLGYYLLGLAIGLIMVGMIVNMRSKLMQASGNSQPGMPPGVRATQPAAPSAPAPGPVAAPANANR